MANLVSSQKDIRRIAKSRAANTQRRSELRTVHKSLLQLIESKKKDESLEKFREFTKKVDTAARKKLIKLNKASRQKSRLALKINKIQA